MPTYEYACAKCGIIDVFQSMSEDALSKCPECGSKKIERLISGGAGVIFKGEGFWETDYNRSDDYKKQSKDGTKAESKKPEKTDSTNAETKKPEPKPKAQTERKKRDN